ncbi:MAG: helix-turn-helix transcriptional regulator [Chitinophagaceae bacterium]|nr:helix-turn-helix transcriptional regulator [Bacteroidota bacterium]
MATQFGERIRELRTKQGLLLRQLASKLDVDTSIISKVERGDRQLKKDQIPLLAEILQADVVELETLWLADQIYEVIKDEKLANEAMQVAEKNINLKKRKK